MSTVTVAPTVELSNTPPRVRLNITDIGSPAYPSVTVTRLNPDGRVVPVRTGDGNPLTLTTSGATRIGTLYDYEVPYGTPVSYSTQENPTTVSAEVTVAEAKPWLIHLGVPVLSMPIKLRAGALAEEVYPVRQNVLYPMGRTTPVVVASGARQAMSSSLTLWVDTLQEVRDVRALIYDAAVLFLNIPQSMGFGVDASYIAVSDVTIARPSDIGGDPQRSIEMPFVVVDRPAGGSQAQRNYADVIAGFASYAQVRAAYNDYAALLAGP